MAVSKILKPIAENMLTYIKNRRYTHSNILFSQIYTGHLLFKLNIKYTVASILKKEMLFTWYLHVPK